MKITIDDVKKQVEKAIQCGVEIKFKANIDYFKHHATLTPAMNLEEMYYELEDKIKKQIKKTATFLQNFKCLESYAEQYQKDNPHFKKA